MLAFSGHSCTADLTTNGLSLRLYSQFRRMNVFRLPTWALLCNENYFATDLSLNYDTSCKVAGSVSDEAIGFFS
jgi:hypothetical protein